MIELTGISFLASKTVPSITAQEIVAFSAARNLVKVDHTSKQTT
jgi:hypothetical protein